MKRAGRNDPCPCGSGLKFKKCHWGREDEITPEMNSDLTPEEMGHRITSLPTVDYGHSKEMADALNVNELTGRDVRIKFLDLRVYANLGLLGSGTHEAARGKGGGLFVNPYKTAKADPNHLYVAISPDVDDSTLIHEFAHALAYLKSGKAPGTLDALGFELDIPVDHLEHTDEFGCWLDYLRKRFGAVLDADDAVILYLYQNGQLIKAAELDEKNGPILRAKSERIFTFLGEKSLELDAILRDLPGYIGPRTPEE
jgi:hypothetical protein